MRETINAIMWILFGICLIGIVISLFGIIWGDKAIWFKLALTFIISTIIFGIGKEGTRD